MCRLYTANMSANTVRAKKPISPQRSVFLLWGEHSDLPSRPGEGNQHLFPLAETNQATQITGKSQKRHTFGMTESITDVTDGTVVMVVGWLVG